MQVHKMLTTIVNYTAESKAKSFCHDNYTDVVDCDTSKKRNSCGSCIFVGRNNQVSEQLLCAENIVEVAEVKTCGLCDGYKSVHRLYNQINPIKKWLLERTGFEFNHR